MLWIAACSEWASGFLKGKNVCCDGLAFLEPILVSADGVFYNFKSCEEYVNNGEYVKDVCPQTCAGKSY